MINKFISLVLILWPVALLVGVVISINGWGALLSLLLSFLFVASVMGSVGVGVHMWSSDND